MGKWVSGRGGKREGAGRKALTIHRETVSFRLTEDEEAAVRALIADMRSRLITKESKTQNDTGSIETCNKELNIAVESTNEFETCGEESKQPVSINDIEKQVEESKTIANDAAWLPDMVQVATEPYEPTVMTVAEVVGAMRHVKKSYTDIASELNRRGLRTARGKDWSKAAVDNWIRANK